MYTSFDNNKVMLSIIINVLIYMSYSIHYFLNCNLTGSWLAQLIGYHGLLCGRSWGHVSSSLLAQPTLCIFKKTSASLSCDCHLSYHVYYLNEVYYYRGTNAPTNFQFRKLPIFGPGAQPTKPNTMG